MIKQKWPLYQEHIQRHELFFGTSGTLSHIHPRATYLVLLDKYLWTFSPVAKGQKKECQEKFLDLGTNPQTQCSLLHNPQGLTIDLE